MKKKILPFLLIIIVLPIMDITQISSQRNNKFNYYFCVLYNSTLTTVGYNDSTAITLYKISEEGIRNREFSDTVNRMEKKEFIVTPGCYVLESDKRLNVYVARSTKYTTAYITSTSGTYVGKEFIFPSYSTAIRTGQMVTAYEDSIVRLYDEKGKKIQEFKIYQNHSKLLKTLLGKVYRVVSTGNIMVQQFHGGSQGAGMLMVTGRNTLVGKWFVSYHMISDSNEGFIIVFPYEPSEVKIIKVETGVTIGKHKFTKEDVINNKYWKFKITEKPCTLKVVSTGNVSVIDTWGSQWEDYILENIRGMSIYAIPANLEVKVLALNSTIIIAPYKTDIEVNNVPFTLDAGQYLRLQGQLVYKIKADKPIVIHIINKPSSGMGGWLIADKDIGKILPPPKPSSIKEEKGTNNNLLLIGVVIITVVAVLAILLYLKKKNRFR
ncbi:MAG: hypothetical protein B6U94_08450 [Thermofilum sp. ex4484_79]|nr:MAG: hypothetical protein B6U94_08450 [Thermofilum sp. ex4484_79]